MTIFWLWQLKCLKIEWTGFWQTNFPSTEICFHALLAIKLKPRSTWIVTWIRCVTSFRFYLEDEFRRADFNYNNHCWKRQRFLRLIDLQKNFVMFVRSVRNSRFFNTFFWIFSSVIFTWNDLAKAADADSVCNENLENNRELLGCWHVVRFFLQVKVQLLRFNLWP